MVQLACLDSDSVLRVLSILARGLGENVRGGDLGLVRRVGAWAWGLLGKCREVGELATDQVGELRDLGKRAAKILLKMQENEFKRSAEDSDASDSDPGDAEEPRQEEINQAKDQGEDSPAGASVDQQDTDMADVDLSAALEAAKLRLQAKLQSETDLDATNEQSRAEHRDSAQQARVLLDMIITIVGEFFGQRDLLDAREVWTRDEALAEL